MTNAAVQAGRDWFENKLRETAGKKNVPIDKVSWNDVPRQDASELKISSSHKEKMRRIADFDLIHNKPDRNLEQLIDEIIDSLS